MRRRKNTRPTLIYWLIDIRPETIAAGWHSGYPFYCGKTVLTAERRLIEHLSDAPKQTHRPVYFRTMECGKEYVRVETMEVVPADANWVEREKQWIKVLRFSFPDNCNACDGGSGATGFVPTAETRARLSAACKGIPKSPEWRALMSATQKGRRFSDEHRAKLKEAWRLNPDRFADHVVSDEIRTKISVLHKGKKRTVESRARMSAAAVLREAKKRAA